MKNFLKENIVLITGISLPLLLALVFFAATQAEKRSAIPPAYRVIFATDYQKNTNTPYQIFIKDKQVRFRYTPPEEKQRHTNWRTPHLFVYDPATETSREIELPTVDDPEVAIDITISELTEKETSSLRESPDGYTFELNYRDHGNIMTELFGGGYSHRNEYVLRKETYRIVIPKTASYDTEFIGWIVKE